MHDKRKMNVQIRQLFALSLSLVILFLAACGGGGTTAGGGIGGTGVVASGAITDKGSIFVNGVEYGTSSAAVTINGLVQPDDSGLRRGMGVRVDGVRDTISTATANAVSYEEVVRGPVTGVNVTPQAITLTVLGQTVVVEQDITYVDDNLGGVTTVLPDFTGTEIEVSGLRDTVVAGLPVINGPVRATYIDIKETPLSEYEVKGVVENANPTSFEIDGLTVTTDGSTVGAIPPDGTPVEVKGTNFNASTDTLVATSLETRAAGLGEAQVEHAEVEGFVSNLTASTFELDGQPVDYSGAIFEGGLPGDLDDGIKVEAEGPVNNGTLVADKIEFKESIRIEGDAGDGDDDGSFAIIGLAGLTIFVDSALTEYKDFSNVSANDHVEIRGREITGSGNILATKIRLRSADTRVELQAPVSTFSQAADTVELAGTVSVDTSDPFIFKDFNNLNISRESFYGNLTVDDLVKARGDLTGSAVNWTEIEREVE